MKHISFNNFRAFREQCDFEFAPITILTGTNSSGKSSLTDGLRFLLAYLPTIDVLNSNVLPFNKLPDRFSNFGQFICRDTKSDTFTVAFETSFKHIEDAAVVTLEFGSTKDGDGFLKKFDVFSKGHQKHLIVIEYTEQQLTSKLDLQYFIGAFETSIAKQKSIYSSILSQGSKFNEDLCIRCRTSDLFNIEELDARYLESILGKNDFPNIIDYGSLLNIFFKDPCYDDGFATIIGKPPEFIIAELEKIVSFQNSTLYNYREQPEEDSKSVDLVLAAHKLNVADSLNDNLRAVESDLFKEIVVQIYDADGKPLNEEIAWGLLRKVLSDPLPYLFAEEEKIDSIYVSCQIASQSSNFPSLKKFLEEVKFSISSDWTRDHLTERNYGNYFFSDFLLMEIRALTKSFSRELEMQFVPSIRALQAKRFLSNDTFLSRVITSMLGVKEFSSPVMDFLRRQIRRFNIAEDILIERNSEFGIIVIRLKKSNGHLINVVDEGYGFSQVLPVILAIALEAERRSVRWYDDPDYFIYRRSKICIEEPETNLHPALQSQLADMIVEANKDFNIDFIIETHSEYLIRKLQYLTRRADSNLEPEDAVIHYFYHPEKVPENERQVKKIAILGDGSLTDDFGTGFFDEADKIAISILGLNQSQKN